MQARLRAVHIRFCERQSFLRFTRYPVSAEIQNTSAIFLPLGLGRSKGPPIANTGTMLLHPHKYLQSGVEHIHTMRTYFVAPLLMLCYSALYVLNDSASGVMACSISGHWN